MPHRLSAEPRLLNLSALPLPVLASFLLLAIMILASFMISIYLTQNTDRAGSIAEYRRNITDATSTVRAMESSQRGYLLTREDRYLDLYRELSREVEKRFDAIGASLPGRGEGVQRELRPLFDRKLTELKASIDLAPAEALAVVRSGVGEETMNRIRVVTVRERAWAAQEVNASVATSRTALRALTGGLIVGAIGIVLLSLFWIRQSRLAFGAAETARQEAESALAAFTVESEARQRAEGQVRQLQKTEAIGQLTGGIAHDFNNMLAVVLGGIELAKRRLRTDPDKADQLLDNAREGATRAATLTSRLLAFSRNQPLAPTPLDLNKLVGGMCEMLGRTLGDNVEVECVYAAGLWRCYADAGEVENAILNLAINARDAMAERGGGKLTVETANAHVDDLYARDRTEIAAGQYVLVCLTDTGVGMSPETVERAFDPFFTTKPVGKGTGLGLSQVFGFAKQSGGHVAIYSEPGAGTTVKLYLPRFTGKDGVQKVAATPDAMPEGHSGEVILVVEDEQRVRHFAVDALRELGYTAISADSPAEALKALGEQPEITMLFTDIVMPEMTGRQLADAALAVRPDLKVLFTTGYTRNAVVHNGVLDIGVAFLAKPYGMADLARKVRDVLDGGGINRPV